MHKITVIIPCYNVEQYIERCIKSLEAQIYQDFEVICVDDASKDNTVKILKKIVSTSKLSIQIIQNEMNCGPAKSRNRGILAASSEFITFCDADDWYETEYLNKLLQQLETNSADLAVCGYSVVDENGNRQERPLATNIVLEKKEQILSLDVDSLCMLMVKTAIMQDTLLPDIRNGEDMAVVPLIMMKANKCVSVSDCLYNYYRRSGSASEKPTMKTVDSFILSYKHIQKYFPDQYGEILEYIGVRNLLYAGLITLFSISFQTGKANIILNRFEQEYPRWVKNRFIKNMPRYKRIVLNLVHRRMYLCIWFIAKVRNIMAGRK